jgi:hypothetical protein
MPRRDYFEFEDEENIFGEYNYLTYMAQNASKGPPLPVLWSMAEEKSGDFNEALDDYIETSGLNGDDPIAEYGGLDADPYAEEEEDWWSYLGEIPDILQGPGGPADASGLYGMSELEKIAAMQAERIAAQGPPITLPVGEIPDILQGPFYPGGPREELPELFNASQQPVGNGGGGWPFMSAFLGLPNVAGDVVDWAGDIGSNVWDFFTQGQQAEGQLALAEGYGDIGSNLWDLAGDALGVMEQAEIDRAEALGMPDPDEYTIFEELNAAYPDLADVQKLIDAGVTESDIQAWADSARFPGRGDEDFLNGLIDLVGAQWYEGLPPTGDLGRTPEEVKADRYRTWRDAQIPPADKQDTIPDITADTLMPWERKQIAEEIKAYEGEAVSEADPYAEEEEDEWSYDEPDTTPKEPDTTPKEPGEITDILQGPGGPTGEDILPGLLRDTGDYTAATENLRSVFYPMVYQQEGVGQATDAELQSLLYQTRILFFLEKGETAWGDMAGYAGKMATYEEGGYSAEDRPALETNYEGWLGGYLERPFAQRINPTEGPDFYSLVRDVSSMLSTDLPQLTQWAYSQLKPGEIGRGQGVLERQRDLEDKFVWVQGLFGGKENQGTRDELVKMGLTHGGMGYYSQQIHNSAQKLMDYYRNIGWTEDRIFDRMTKGMKKPQAAPMTDTDILELFDKEFATSPGGNSYPD